MTSPAAWSLASRVAANLAGSYPLADGYHLDALAAQAPELVARAERLVEEETGLASAGVPTVRVVDRAEWVDRNIAFFAKVIAPAVDALRASTDGQARFSWAADRLVGAETGALLGVLSRRVLGQYELVLPTDDDEAGDAVYLVGANVLALERNHQLRPAEFRLWLALHECTHRLQFVGVPWMRQYFLGLVHELVATSRPEPGRARRIGGEIFDAARRGEPLLDEAGLFGVFASPEQRAIIDRVQALMALLEGHGHVMMDRIGRRLLVSNRRMSLLFRQRRKDPRMAAFLRLTGLEMKLKQYEMGERFILGVERLGGPDALAPVWVSAAHLPTLAEIESPDAWLSRVA